MRGFFSPTIALSKPPLSLIPDCGICKLCNNGCLSPKMPVDGNGEKKILLVGEVGGAHEDKSGKPFVGPSGWYLEKVLRKIGVEMRRDCWITNSIICKPEGNRAPTDNEIAYCRPNIIQAIKHLKPIVIIPLGTSAVKSILGWLWKEDEKGLGIFRWAGWRIPCQKINSWVCPTFHPSFLLRSSDNDREDVVAQMYFERHLRAAVNKAERRPWPRIPPDFNNEVVVIQDPKTAVFNIHQIIEMGKPVAWDIETTMLKPDSKDAEIVCCSMSNGDFTFAFPWCGEAIKATKRFLVNKIPKMGWNVKFETRWCQAKLGVVPKNWVWDGMIASHLLDNRAGITSLKFQAFVRLGQASYDDYVKSYFKSDGSNLPNRIRELDLHQLLLYCGLDSLLEYKVGMLLAQKLGVNLVS